MPMYVQPAKPPGHEAAVPPGTCGLIIVKRTNRTPVASAVGVTVFSR